MQFGDLFLFQFFAAGGGLLWFRKRHQFLHDCLELGTGQTFPMGTVKGIGHVEIVAVIANARFENDRFTNVDPNGMDRFMAHGHSAFSQGGDRSLKFRHQRSDFLGRQLLSLQDRGR